MQSLDRDGDPKNVGQRIILFTGGPYYMRERQQDAMSYVRKYGHPDLFITTIIQSIHYIFHLS